jgi:hypothetical protein
MSITPQEAGAEKNVQDTRRDPTPEEAYRLSYDIGADGRNMSPAEQAQLMREVKWPPARSANHCASDRGTNGAPRPHRQAASAASGVEAFVKDMLPILRPVPFKILVGGVVAIVGVVSILLIVGMVTGAGSIQTGDCVTTWTNPFNGNDHINKASCSEASAQKVLEVQNTSDGSCSLIIGAETTFQDQVTGKTYCLGPNYAAGQP